MNLFNIFVFAVSIYALEPVPTPPGGRQCIFGSEDGTKTDGQQGGGDDPEQPEETQDGNPKQ